MRKAILAALALTPVVLHAQANSPAQANTTLESRLSPPAIAAVGDRPATPKTLRVSTGVVAPKLIHSVDVPLDSSSSILYTGPRMVVVGMVIGTDGVPSDLKVIQSAGPVVDKSVLQAVSQFRFTPGTVSSQPIAFPLNLEVNLVASAY